MSNPELIGGLSEVSSRYDVVLCDIWGVVHNGRKRHPSASEALARFGRSGDRWC
jgi:ribonucleotide monophosphatase NagD (HAD superfamily)